MLLQIPSLIAQAGCNAAGNTAPFRGAAALSALAQLLESARASGLLATEGGAVQDVDYSSDTFKACLQLTRQLGDSKIAEEPPVILAKAEQEVKALQAAVTKLPNVDLSTKTVFEFNSSRFTDVPTVLLYLPNITKHCAVLQSPLLDFAADLLDIILNMHLPCGRTCTCKGWSIAGCLQDGLPPPPCNASASAWTSCQHMRRSQPPPTCMQ